MSVWGRVHAAAHQADDHKELKDGEEECGICLSFATELKFKPCGHHACSNCLPQLRRANIFKADAGIKCPFCRQYIDQYEPLDARTLKDERARSLIHEANMAAKAAAMKRDSSNQQAPAAEARPPPSVAQQDNWECTSCDNLNFGSRTKCNRCNAAPPTRTSSSGGLGTTFVTSKDLMQCSHEEILVFATQKLHPNLNRAFAEAGTPYVDNRVGGSRETILAALAKKGQDKLVRIAHLLASCRHVPDLATHFYGNYTLQDLLDATAKLRGVAEQLRTQGKHPPEVMNRLAGGAGQQDAFGELVAAVTPEAARISTHINGTFVVQKCVALGSAAEQVALGRELLKAGLKLMEDQKSMHVMTKLVEGLHAVAMSWDPLAGQAGDVLETLCTLYAKADAAARNRAAHHYFAGQILVASIHGALPRPSAMRLLDQLAQQVVQLSLSKSGGNTLKLLCGLQSPDHKCQDLIATSVCVAASKCEGQFATIAARPGTDGAELVAAMLERLVEEREVDWVLCITSDLVANAGALEGDRAALDLLAKALCLDALDDQIVADHLKVLSTLLRRPQAVGDQVCKQRPGVKPLLAPPAPPASPPAPPVSTSGLPNGSPAPPPPTPLTMGRTPVMQSSPAGAEGPVGATTSSQPQPPPQHVKTPPGFAGQAGPSGTRQANPASPPRHQAKSQAPPAAPAQQAQQAKQAQQPPAVSRPPATAPFPPPPPAPLAASQAPQQGASSSSSSSAPAVPNMMGFLPHMMAQPSAAQQPPAQSSVAQRPPGASLYGATR
ncbi:hypothetical protein WJX72_000146 [[Myrmecia] bisecta]|uniref:RanBP-type and C3HC4-type zinc finger-containing protein 1 n=1 Tax=[Myrmecia] bisecta TaxID=41462 RepID=A0AAW1PMS8_9CHLO